MDLTALQFRVDTKELLDAKKAVVDLGVAVGNLNKITKEEAQSAINSAKVRKANADAAAKEAVEREKAAKALLAENKATQQSTTVHQSNISVLERQQSILRYMTEGFSRGQATILTYAKASGALTSELKELGGVLQTQRKLIGGDVFDKSMSGLVALKNQYGEIREAIRQYNSDTGLTRNQTRELARDKERIIEKMKIEGASFSDIKNAIKSYNIAYVDAARKVNALTNIEKERERSIRDRVNAIRNVQSAEERLFSTVSNLNSGTSDNAKLNERAALALGSYERNLRLAGITGQDAAKKLQAFRAAQEQVTAAEMKHRASYVARGVGVQMGDVAVSLASGMNPLLVAIQQSDQIRGLIQQSGLEAAQMGGIMQQAFLGIAKSFRDVGTAMLSFVGGAITTVGKTAIKGLYDPLKYVAISLKELFSKENLNLDIGPQISRAELAARAARESLAGLASIIKVSLVGAFAVLGVAMYQTASANDSLMISVTSSGAAIGLTSKELIKFAEANNIAGVSANSLKGALGELAAAGFTYKDTLAVVTEAAQMYAKATGQDLNEVMKEYAKVVKEPLESLIALGKATGQVDVETIRLVETLIKQGKIQEATKIAIEATASAQIKAAKDIEDSLSPLAKFLREMKTDAIATWDTIVDFANSELIVGGFRRMYQTAKDVRDLIKELGTLIPTSLIFGTFDTKPLRDAIGRVLGTVPAATRSSEGKITPVSVKTPPEKAADVVAEERRMKAMKSYYDQQEKNAAKHMSRMAFINKEVARVTAEAGGYLSEKDIGVIEREAGDAWDKANKDRMSAAKKIESYYERVLEKIADLNVKNTVTTENLTKAEQILLDIRNDPLWKSLTSAQKKDIENRIESAKAIELETQAYQSQKRQLETLESFKSKYSTDAQKELLALQNKNKDIGLTEEQKLVNEQLLKIETYRLDALQRISEKVAEEKKKNFNLDDAKYRLKLEKDLAEAIDVRRKVEVQAAINSYNQSRTFQAGWDQAFAAYTDAATNSATLAKSAFDKLTDGMSDGLTEFVTTGKLSFKDFANSVIKDLLKIETKALAVSILGGLSGKNPEYGGIGGLIGKLFSSTDTVGTTAEDWLMTAPSLSSGGYTGSGGTYEPAGIVHKGEVVWSKRDVANAGGVGVVEGMRRGLGGYANGGVVAQQFPSKVQDNNQVQVSVTVASDGSTRTETSPQTSGKELGDAIAAAVTAEIIKQKRNGGLLATR